ncbi:SRPBCC domain-containing protein [Paenibacillus provencensis]|uniref:SRPBCC domain-containing protein n=1 Tax=Paenibacillus provencensis TaxID=441151 RepID=A0ABW3PVM0_9BACL|nr:SRPBCC domain-containing protein [Paenibacillus sp. MER 78]MCM3128562.1 SRPBCC domain-containing protein [Paenibacillus sp. MER 78]
MTQTLPDIQKTIVIDAPIEKVWSTVATAEGIAAWFMPNDFEPVLGHEFHLQAGPFGNSLCKVTELDPPHRLCFKWDKDWIITFELAEKDGRTEFTLTHGGWSIEEKTSFGEDHSVVRDRMSGGWTGILSKLAAQFGA